MKVSITLSHTRRAIKHGNQSQSHLHFLDWLYFFIFHYPIDFLQEISMNELFLDQLQSATTEALMVASAAVITVIVFLPFLYSFPCVRIIRSKKRLFQGPWSLPTLQWQWGKEKIRRKSKLQRKIMHMNQRMWVWVDMECCNIELLAGRKSVFWSLFQEYFTSVISQ